MATCSLSGGAPVPFRPYSDYDGLSVMSYELDESYAYLLHFDTASNASNGVYRLNLTSHEATQLLSGDDNLLRLAGDELWLSDAKGRIYRTPTNGSGSPEFVVDQGDVRQIELDDKFLCWHRYTSSQVGCIKRMLRPRLHRGRGIWADPDPLAPSDASLVSMHVCSSQFDQQIAESLAVPLHVEPRVTHRKCGLVVVAQWC